MVDTLSPIVDVFKVGSQLFTICGPVSVRHILVQGKKVFLDLKYHDIPNTVALSTSAAIALGIPVLQKIGYNREKFGKLGLSMLTIHTAGGEEMLKRAVEAATKQSESIGVIKPLILGITILTSEEKRDNIHSLVMQRAALAKKCGLDGVVASSQESALIRREFGDDWVIVTPGIRPKGSESETDDQKRVATPKEAIENGSNYLVVGRPIIRADDPPAAAQMILEEISQI